MKKIQNKLMGVLLGTLVVVCLCSCGKDTVYYVDEENTTSETESTSQTEEDVTVLGDIYVYVCGAVQKPGVYILPEGSRIFDAFEMAGGFTEEASMDYWNQARVLKDGEMIYVPTAAELEDSTFSNKSVMRQETNDKNKVNINTASKEELMTLPGIGETRALAILEYRQEHGPFTSIEDLKNVEGIKDGVFSKMKDYIVIN